MSALAAILAERGFNVTGSDPRDGAVMDQLRRRGVRVFRQQDANTVAAICSGTSMAPLVVTSTAVPQSNPELQQAVRMGLQVVHRSDLLAALIDAQPSIAVAGSHGKTTTSSLVATLLQATHQDPTAVIGGIVPAFGSNGRVGKGRLLVAEADESDGSLVKFHPQLAILTNLELDHTDHYPNLEALVATLQRFAAGAGQLLANRDCPVLRDQFKADHWWSITSPEAVGTIGVIAPESSSFLGFLSLWLPAVCAGNTVVCMASESRPLPALLVAESMPNSDVPAGVFNLITGLRKELLPAFAAHRDLDGLIACATEKEAAGLRELGADNLKRVRVVAEKTDFTNEHAWEGPEAFRGAVEYKTVWHPMSAE